MKLIPIAVAAAMVLAAAPAVAQNTSHAPGGRQAFKPLGPIGLDGFPPSPLCRESLGLEMHIHCLHNLVWHGGKTYYIDDVTPKAQAKAKPKR